MSWYDDEDIEFHISTPEQLAGLSELVNTGKTMEGKTFILDNDLYLNDVSGYDEWKTTSLKNTLVGNGTTMIYAFCSGSRAACFVTVRYDYYLSNNELSLKKGRLHDLAVYSVSTNEEVTDIDVVWSSSDDSTVSIDEEPIITLYEHHKIAIYRRLFYKNSFLLSPKYRIFYCKMVDFLCKLWYNISRCILM